MKPSVDSLIQLGQLRTDGYFMYLVVAHDRDVGYHVLVTQIRDADSSWPLPHWVAWRRPSIINDDVIC